MGQVRKAYQNRQNAKNSGAIRMDCAVCNSKICRKADACGIEKFDIDEIKIEYAKEENQKIIKAASALVDDGRAGSLSRLNEIIEFVKTMSYSKVGLAYCYGMEKDARAVRDIFRNEGIKLSTVSCTVGGIPQNAVNLESCNYNVSCNPIGQAKQLELENTEFVITMGICLGHDILLQRNLKVDFTTFVVKDRVFSHKPLAAVSNN